MPPLSSKPAESNPYVSLDLACHIIQSGGVVAIPTETVYGLAGSLFQEKALRQIFHIKKRPFFNPLIVHCADKKSAHLFHNVTDPLLDKMMDHFSPGPLTFVLNKTPKVHPLITAGQAKVALRIPRHPLTLKLIKQTGALCAPSANVFGKLSPTRPEHVYLAFQGQVPIIKGGECKGGIESTVIEPDFKKQIIHILRLGLISQKDLKKWIKKEKLKGWDVVLRPSSLSPGQLKQHYQPAVPLIIIDCVKGKIPSQKEVENLLTDFMRHLDKTAKKLLPQRVFKALKLKRSPALSARLLYHELSVLSQNPSNIIYVIKKEEHQKEDWQAIWDRLHKASSYNLDQTGSGRVPPLSGGNMHPFAGR